MAYPSRKNLIATISPTPYAKPLLLDMAPPNPAFYINVAASGVALVGSGGAGAPYSYTISSGSLPTGLSLNGSTGAITGTPTVQGTSAFVAQVTDSASNTFQHGFAITVRAALGILQGGGAPVPGRRGIAYQYQFRVADFTGSTSGVTYSITSGSAPGGLSLSSGGLLSGTPTAPAIGTTTFTVTATKTGDGSLAIPCSMVVYDQVSAGTLTVPTELRNMTKGVPVAAYLTTASITAIGTLIFSIASGALPSGLTMDAYGLVSGTPDTITSPTYTQPTIAVTDSATGATNTFSLTGSNVFKVGVAFQATSGGNMYRADTNGEPTGFDYIAQYFGDGSDGDITIDASSNPSFAPLVSGVNVANRPIFANNLTITGSGSLDMAGQRLFVAGVLDITSAGANGIIANESGLARWATAGGVGGNSTTGAGGAGSVANNVTLGAGGNGGGGATNGVGGFGSAGAGGAGAAVAVVTTVNRISPFHENDSVISGSGSFGGGSVAFVGGGAGGAGGGAGGGNGAIIGGSGGGGGVGGGRLVIYARTINRSGSTAVGAIGAHGWPGSTGVAGGGAGRGGGGGGAGGGGGFVRIIYGNLTGSTAADAIDAGGGAGGNGGAAGGGTSAAGTGNNGGNGGWIILNDLLNASTSTVVGSSGSAHSGVTGGAGGACLSDL